MDFRLTTEERNSLIAMLTGTPLLKACAEMKVSYEKMKRCKNAIFPHFKGKKKYEYKSEDALVILDFAIEAVKHCEPTITCGTDLNPPSLEALQAMRKHVAAEFEIDPVTPIFVDLSPLRRAHPEAFEKVMRLADAAQTMESVGEFLKSV